MQAAPTEPPGEGTRHYAEHWQDPEEREVDFAFLVLLTAEGHRPSDVLPFSSSPCLAG
jgi:hypothetical protein